MMDDKKNPNQSISWFDTALHSAASPRVLLIGEEALSEPHSTSPVLESLVSSVFISQPESLPKSPETRYTHIRLAEPALFADRLDSFFQTVERCLAPDGMVSLRLPVAQPGFPQRPWTFWLYAFESRGWTLALRLADGLELLASRQTTESWESARAGWLA
ncbi:MAG: hypothetical protein RBU29_03960, partial [bacterium]|nr:hypothetical protein [bacterium]